MNQFGLIGRNISYSFSQKYFSDKFLLEQIKNVSYQTFDLNEISQLKELVQNKNLKGLNITIPYKEEILPFLDKLSPEAEKIGAVNCIRIERDAENNPTLIGFNTDAYGFKNSLKPLLESHHQKALILGDGGAAKAVKYALDKLEIPHKSVTRNGNFHYSGLTNEIIQDHQIIINSTPLGTFPDVENAPDIPYEFLTNRHLLYDLIYNPEKTKFLKNGEIKGAKIKNGYEMLVLQAEKSWEIWKQCL